VFVSPAHQKKRGRRKRGDTEGAVFTNSSRFDDFSMISRFIGKLDARGGKKETGCGVDGRDRFSRGIVLTGKGRRGERKGGRKEGNPMAAGPAFRSRFHEIDNDPRANVFPASSHWGGKGGGKRV